MEGSYPYGRTGKTPQEPVAGFCHFKYGKQGEPVVRLIKPGKYTPYKLSSDGDISTPYEERGSKMKRERSAKYRHIASYSMEELIELGWDGAMYNSVRGRHAVKGCYVPFICGYDSDAEDDYEPINVQAGKLAGTIGLPPGEIGLYMILADLSNPDRGQVVQLKKG